MGSTDHDELLKHVALADLVVVPSRYEGFGLTALEAMALGKPVLATTAGGLPEVVGDAGILVDVANPTQLGEQILRLAFDESLRADLGHLAAIRARGKFSLNRITASLIAD